MEMNFSGPCRQRCSVQAPDAWNEDVEKTSSQGISIGATP